jgi:hypothetical protein
MTHASKAIMADLSKLDDVIRANVKRVSSSDTASCTPDGANPPVTQQDMSKKIGRHLTTSIPDTTAPPTSGATKPLNTPWPTNSETFSSGLARPGRIGTMPSFKAPSR